MQRCRRGFHHAPHCGIRLIVAIQSHDWATALVPDGVATLHAQEETDCLAEDPWAEAVFNELDPGGKKDLTAHGTSSMENDS